MIMRECPFCGNELPDRSQICIYCGSSLGKADDAGAAARKHRQIVLTVAAVGVFVVLVAVFSLIATISSDGGDDGHIDSFGSRGYVFSSHTTSGAAGTDESEISSENGKSSSSAGDKKRSSSSLRKKTKTSISTKKTAKSTSITSS